jgi:hypothetical protein
MARRLCRSASSAALDSRFASARLAFLRWILLSTGSGDVEDCARPWADDKLRDNGSTVRIRQSGVSHTAASRSTHSSCDLEPCPNRHPPPCQSPRSLRPSSLRSLPRIWRPSRPTHSWATGRQPLQGARVRALVMAVTRQRQKRSSSPGHVLPVCPLVRACCADQQVLV